MHAGRCGARAMAGSLEKLSEASIQHLDQAACRVLLKGIGLKCPRSLAECRAWLADVRARMAEEAPQHGGGSQRGGEAEGEQQGPAGLHNLAEETLRGFLAAHPSVWQAMLTLEPINLDSLLLQVNLWSSTGAARAGGGTADLDASDSGVVLIDADADSDGSCDSDEDQEHDGDDGEGGDGDYAGADGGRSDAAAAAAGPGPRLLAGSGGRSSSGDGTSSGGYGSSGGAELRAPRTLAAGMGRAVTKPQLRDALEAHGVVFADPRPQAAPRSASGRG